MTEAVAGAEATLGNLSWLLGRIHLLGGEWLRVRVGRDRGFAMPADRNIAVHFVVRGTLELHVDQQIITLPTGATALLPHCRAHSLRNGRPARLERLSELADLKSLDIPRTVTIGPEREMPAAVVLTAQLHFDWPTELPRTDALPAVLLGTQTYRTNQPAADAAAQALEQTAVTPGASACLSRFAELLLTRQLRDVLVSHPQLLSARDEATAALIRAVEAVRMKPDHDWTVVKLARHAGMSRSTFAAMFKALYGRGPMEVVAEQRMEIAARMLREGRMRVKSVAARVGYTSTTAFLRRFSVHFGMPPATYKRQNRQGTEGPADWLDIL